MNRALQTLGPIVAAGALALSAVSALAVEANQAQVSGHGNEPSLACTLKVVHEGNDAGVKSMVRITPSEAVAAARATGSGTLGAPKVENENGCVVYSVKKTANGQTVDVLVDAGNGKVLKQDASIQEDAQDEERESTTENERAEHTR